MCSIGCMELLVCFGLLGDEAFEETSGGKVSMGGMSTHFGGDRPAGGKFFFVSGKIRPKHALARKTDGIKPRHA